uniref:C2H2-type domain-containing protein n=1 Tax=Clastoptera arizonana TaxID=38151 RepID=A0A1B6DAI6_9HEMI
MKLTPSKNFKSLEFRQSQIKESSTHKIQTKLKDFFFQERKIPLKTVSSKQIQQEQVENDIPSNSINDNYELHQESKEKVKIKELKIRKLRNKENFQDCDVNSSILKPCLVNKLTEAEDIKNVERKNPGNGIDPNKNSSTPITTIEKYMQKLEELNSDSEDDLERLEEIVTKFVTSLDSSKTNIENIDFQEESSMIPVGINENENGANQNEYLIASPMIDKYKILLSELKSDSDDDLDALKGKLITFASFLGTSNQKVESNYNLSSGFTVCESKGKNLLYLSTKKSNDKKVKVAETFFNPEKLTIKTVGTSKTPKKTLIKSAGRVKSIKQSRFKKRKNANWSVALKTRSTVYSCDKCSVRFPTWFSRIKHWQKTEHKTAEKCHWCLNNFFYIHKHVFNTHSSMCEHCGMLFLSPLDKRNHLDEHLDKSLFSCHHCQAAFNNTEELKSHMEIHTGKLLFICEFCEMDFDQEQSLIAHLSKFHFICEICNFQCLMKFHFDEHMLKHNEKLPFFCEKCDKTFANSKTLRNHNISKHKKILSYECDKCGKKFALEYKLLEHKQTHEGKNYKCNLCSLSFIKKRYLRSHKENHPNYICNFCGKEYTSKIKLTYHLRGSSGDGFLCQKCNLDCNCFEGYKKHMIKHERKGEMTTTCPICEIEFKNNAAFKRHLILKHPQDSIRYNKQVKICNHCKHVCSSSHHLAKHIRLKHHNIYIKKNNVRK